MLRLLDGRKPLLRSSIVDAQKTCSPMRDVLQNDLNKAMCALHIIMMSR
jgi:hypothetical protein